MELRHLRYFVAVAETENVSRAALKLHVSQPALSRQIRDLEEELGFDLLERSAKSVRLTRAGHTFLEEARAVLKRASQAVEAARRVANEAGGELNVGYAPTLAVRMLPAALREFQSAMPGVRVRLHDLAPAGMIAGVRDGTLDMALTVRPLNGLLRSLVFRELRREPLRLAVAPTHRFAARASVSLADAVREPMLVYSREEYPDYFAMLMNLLRPLKSEPRLAGEHDGILSLVSAVESGNGVAVVTASTSCTSGNRLKLLPLKPEPRPVVVGAVLQRPPLKPAAALFLECLQRAADSE
jgi:LysR family transcriptional regulator, benzoate and cis,cis-muconate-responsive activator of ben and cat genes